MDDLLPIADDGFGDTIHSRYAHTGGVYLLIAVSTGKRVPINRFLGTDANGILYIGKAGSFTDRVIDLKKSIAPTYQGKSHICGRRYKQYPGIALKFPYHTLFVQLIPSSTPEVLEKQLITEYAHEFGEVPPLNAV